MLGEIKNRKMNINNFSEQIGGLIGKDQLQDAIALLHKVLKNSPLLDEAIMHSARYSDLTKQIRLGIIDFQQAGIEKNRIRYAILDLIRDIEENVELNPIISNEVKNLPEEKPKTDVAQFHYGSGDNVVGNKIVNN